VRWYPAINDVSMEAEDIVGVHCQAVPSEDIEGLECAVVNCNVHELVKVLQLLIIMSGKSPVNPTTNPNPVSNH
jgi:hypothetical protein